MFGGVDKAESLARRLWAILRRQKPPGGFGGLRRIAKDARTLEHLPNPTASDAILSHKKVL